MNNKAYAALVGMDCTVGDMQWNTKTIIDTLYVLVQTEPRTAFAAFPELCLYGYDSFSGLRDKSYVQITAACLKSIAAVCRELRLEVVLGAPFFVQDRIENALYFISSDGTIRHVFSKMHLLEAERHVFSPGTGAQICSTCLGRTGFMICWDAAFPSLAHTYLQNNADVLVISAAWETEYRRQWITAVEGTAFYTATPVLAVNRTGKDGATPFCGKNMAVSCMGVPFPQKSGKNDTVTFISIERLKTKDMKMRETFGSPLEEEKTV